VRLRHLRSRLTLGVVAVLAVVLGIGGVVVVRDQDGTERRAIDDRLKRTAELTDTTALAAVEQEVPEADPRLNQVLRATGSSLRVTVGATTLITAGVSLPDSVRGPIGFSTRSVQGRRVRIYVKTLRADALGGLARLQTTTSLRAVETRQRRLRARLLLLGLAMLVVTGLGTWFAADRVLRPLRRLRAATTDIATDEDLERRVPEAGPAEVRGLARSFNGMLERLGRSASERQRALHATRRFAADAGHELRTPLTAVQATLSTIHRHPEMDPGMRQEIVAGALDEQRRLVALLDGLQALARGDANPVDEDDVDLVGLVADSVMSVRSGYPGTTFATVVPDHPVVVRGWEPGLRLVLDNLLLNAARHGATDGNVRVTLLAPGADEAARLVVEDDGAGVPVQERERIFQPFARAAGVASPGSGLGLALVAQQVGHHGAGIAVDESPLGGARFTVTF